MRQALNHSLLAVGALVTSSSFVPLSTPEQGVVPNPSFLVGKQVKSVVMLKKAEGVAAGGSQGGGSVTMAGPSDQTVSRVLSVKKDKGDDFLLERSVKRVQMTVVSVLGKSTYDSDNAFERDPVTSALGQHYDPYVNKSYKTVYRSKTNGADQTTKDPKFENIWGMNMPTLLKETTLQGILLPELPKTLTPGTTWVDSVQGEGATTINRYRVVKKEGDLLYLTLESQRTPGAGQSQTSSSSSGGYSVSATSTANATAYKGELRVRQSNGFIEELRLVKQAASTVTAAGQTMQNNSNSTVVIQNTLN